MESFESIQYSSFDKKGTNSRIKYDECDKVGNTRDEIMSTKPLKYYTHDFFHQTPCESDSLNNLSRGIQFNNGFGKSAVNIDTDSKIRYGKTENRRMHGDLPSLPLPTTASYISGQGNVKIEDSKLRPLNDNVSKTCNIKDTEFYNRSFQLFPEGVVRNPMSYIDMIVPGQLECGISTKTMVKEKYKRG
jgi:hypothetical protein